MHDFIKRATADTAGVILILAVGIIIGWLLSLTIQQAPTISWSDIGGLVADAGTVGLLVVALRTASSWKDQLLVQDRIQTIEEYTEARRMLTKCMVEIVSIPYFTKTNPVDDEIIAYQQLSLALEWFQQKHLKLTHAYKISNLHGYKAIEMAHLMEKPDEHRPKLDELKHLREELAKLEEELLSKLYSKGV